MLWKRENVKQKRSGEYEENGGGESDSTKHTKHDG